MWRTLLVGTWSRICVHQPPKMPKNNGAGEVLFASSHFAFERKGRSSQDGEGESYTLTDLNGVNRIDCKSGFGFYAEPRAESQWAAAKRGPGPSPTFRCASSLKHRLRRETR